MEDLLMYQTDWSVVPDNIDLLLSGLLLTLQISALALVFSILFGIILGLCRVSRNKLLSYVATAYIEFIRGVPLLVLLFWIYFVLGKFLQLGAYWSAILGLASFSGAFVAEIVRAGIESVPKGQMEAARASGMSYIQAMRLVILPQAFRKMLPPFASQFIILIKDSSLVSVISVPEVTLVAKNIVATSFRSLEIWTAVAILYFLVNFSLSQVIRFFERRYKLRE
jgi:polar amino acid transport system permease protein